MKRNEKLLFFNLDVIKPMDHVRNFFLKPKFKGKQTSKQKAANFKKKEYEEYYHLEKLHYFKFI